MNDILQWLGFVLIVIGNYYISRWPMGSAMFLFLGAGALALWCALQIPIPLGLLCVQVLVAGISLINFERAMRHDGSQG